MHQQIRSLFLAACATLGAAAFANSIDTAGFPARWVGQGSGNLVVRGSAGTGPFSMDLYVDDVDTDSVVTGRVQYANWSATIESGAWLTNAKRLSFFASANWIEYGAKLYYTGHFAGRAVYNAEVYALIPSDEATVTQDAQTQSLLIELGLANDPANPYLVRPAGGVTAFAR